MYKIQTLNEISDIIHSQLSADEYMVTRDEPVPDAILVRSADMQSMVLPESLQAIARAGAGVNNIPIEACSKRGIVVFNTPGANANAVAELVVAGLLLCSRDIAGGIQWAATLKGKGEEVAKLVEKGKNQFVGPELRGKTLGVIGLGAIGSLVANCALNGLGMEVIGLDPSISVEHAWSLSRGIKRASSLEELLQRSDYVTVHVPLTPKTKGMFDFHLFTLMKNGARLLNFSRAELVDGDACRAALKSRKLGGYVTDFPTDDMLCVPGVTCLPHLGASTPESEENCARMAAAQLRDYLETGTIRNSVNMPEIVLSGQPEGCRILLIHDNVPNMVSNMSAAISREGININNMINKSRQEMAVTVMELSQVPTEELVAELCAQPGVIKVRFWN